ncbi:Glycosyltransferase 92 family protein [Brugia pahangi]
MALYYRTTNIWTLKNIGDAFLSRRNPSRLIIIGAFYRNQMEQNIPGNYVVIQFLADVQQTYRLYCFSTTQNGKQFVYQAHIQRIHQGKRFVNNICSMAGFIAECRVTSQFLPFVQISTKRNVNESLKLPIEKIFEKKRHKLVVCMAPTYALMEWRILLLGIELWLALGASKIIIPIQSISKDAFDILQEYEKAGLVVLRHWPKWPLLSDKNPNGLVLSRGIEESHVNCLFFTKPWAEMVAFTDLDDILIPTQPLKVYSTANIDILQNLSNEHPQAGSFLFEHRDVRMVLPKDKPMSQLDNFNFNFLINANKKKKCTVWRMKTRVIVNASRVDTINMHESGINRFGYVQVRIPCHQAHFYHMRHSFREQTTGQFIDMNNLVQLLNKNFQKRLKTTLRFIAKQQLNSSLTETLDDFDKCIIEINKEHFKLKVSRCMTPHVCYLKLKSEVKCIASVGSYEFAYASGDFILRLMSARFMDSDQNCDAPISKIIKGNYFYAP